MKKYLLLLHESVETMIKLSPKEMEELVKAHMAWAAKLGEQGILVSGEGLEESGVKIISKNCIVEEGPYFKSNEFVGGYYLLQAADIETVIEIAKECPCHLWGGITEIRPVMIYSE